MSVGQTHDSSQDFSLQTMELLASAMALQARSPAFPEFAHLPTLALKRFAKASPVEKFRSQAKLLLDAVDTNVKFVGSRRDAVEFAPKDTKEVESFLKCVGSCSVAGNAVLQSYNISSLIWARCAACCTHLLLFCPVLVPDRQSVLASLMHECGLLTEDMTCRDVGASNVPMLAYARKLSDAAAQQRRDTADAVRDIAATAHAPDASDESDADAATQVRAHDHWYSMLVILCRQVPFGRQSARLSVQQCALFPWGCRLCGHLSG